jgi:deoxyribodipyrimidine photo-lyase
VAAKREKTPRPTHPSRGKRILVWFRADLRTTDNRALYEACREAERGVVAVFTLCPEQWLEHDWAAIKVEFLLRNLQELSAGLARLGIPLRLVVKKCFADVPAALESLVRREDCDALFLNREYEINERRRDRAVERRLDGLGVEVRAFTDQVVLEPGEVLTKTGAFFKVFTPFKRAWIRRVLDLGEIPALGRPRRQGSGLEREADRIPATVKGFDIASGRPDLWPGGERHARQRLRRFIENRIDTYHERRDVPSVNGTSTLSPYLTAGVLSPRQCLHAAIEANGGRLASDDSRSAGPSVWIGELIWREFYKHLLVGFPRLSRNRPFRLETEALRWRESDADCDAWCRGRTGVPIVDAAMRQLDSTGWMHNRLRMIAAMFLSKDLFLDWRLGERHFMRSLVDGDLAANNGGWQWSSSTGTDAAPYFRIFNPVSQSRRFDPEGKFIRKFVPELSELGPREIHEPWKLPAGRRAGLDYPDPICDHKVARARAIATWKRSGA